MGITFERVSVTYDQQWGLKDICLRIGRGFTAVMGKNGAGKTTLLRLAASVIPPDRGEMRLDNQPYLSAASQLRSSLGYLPEMVDFPESLTPRKLLTYLARLRFLDPTLGLELLEQLKIVPLADRHFEELSLGEIRLVGIAQAMMGAPRFLILDEFTRNLSLEERQRVFRCLRDYANQRSESTTVLFSTHLCEDIEALAGQVVLLQDGAVGYSGSPEDLIQRAAGQVKPTFEEAYLWFSQQGR